MITKLLIITVIGVCFANSLTANELVNRRIVGGRLAERHEFPYHVALRYKGKQMAFCGGSIIHNNWILTAAHCFSNLTHMDYDADKIEVVVGTTKLPPPNAQTVNIFGVSLMAYHPDYVIETKVNDVALVKTTSDLLKHQKGIYTEKINLDNSGQGFFASEGTIMGYGDQSRHQSNFRSKVLKTVNVKVLKDDVCRRSSWVYNAESMMCAGNLEGERDACTGDSGGPLVMKTPQGDLQIALISHGFGCARPDIPAVYTRVSTFYSVIQYVMKNY